MSPVQRGQDQRHQDPEPSRVERAHPAHRPPGVRLVAEAQSRAGAGPDPVLVVVVVVVRVPPPVGPETHRETPSALRVAAVLEDRAEGRPGVPLDSPLDVGEAASLPVFPTPERCRGTGFRVGHDNMKNKEWPTTPKDVTYQETEDDGSSATTTSIFLSPSRRPRDRVVTPLSLPPFCNVGAL